MKHIFVRYKLTFEPNEGLRSAIIRSLALLNKPNLALAQIIIKVIKLCYTSNILWEL